MVVVKFPSLISNVTHEKQVEIPAKTLGEALERLVERYGESFMKTIFHESGELNRFLKFYINGKQIESFNLMEEPLKDEDKINILIIVSGG